MLCHSQYFENRIRYRLGIAIDSLVGPVQPVEPGFLFLRIKYIYNYIFTPYGPKTKIAFLLTTKINNKRNLARYIP